MKTRRTTSAAGRIRRRRLCAWGALLALVLLVGPGCDRTIRQEIRQGAFDVFQTGLNTFYGELSANVVSILTGGGGE